MKKIKKTFKKVLTKVKAFDIIAKHCAKSSEKILEN